jgi:hypothetical protein
MESCFPTKVDPNDGALTLREAIAAANQDPADDEIVLQAGVTYTLSILGARVDFVNNIVEDNIAGNRGGGMHADGPDVTLVSNTFRHDLAGDPFYRPTSQQRLLVFSSNGESNERGHLPAEAD